MVAVLAILAISLFVVFLLVLDINSKVLLPEIIQEYGNSFLTLDNLGSYLSVMTGIVALLFPISLSIISDAKGEYFNSEEVSTIVFKHWTYIGLKVIIGLMIIVTIVSFFNVVHSFFLILTFLIIIGSLVFLFFFFKRLEKIIRDFSLLVRQEEKRVINELIGDGEN